METPRPVIRDGNNKLVENYTHDEWFAKIMEEVFEAHEADDKESLGYELADIITVCTSYLNALGYDERACAEFYRHVNFKNEQRGYFEED